MTKAQFLRMFADMYRTANRADSDNELREEWTAPDMAGYACCRHLDHMARDMVKCGALTQEELDTVYATL